MLGTILEGVEEPQRCPGLRSAYMYDKLHTQAWLALD